MPAALTGEEMMLITLYSNGSRTGLIGELKNMKKELQPDEKFLEMLTDSVLEKLYRMSDLEFSELELFL